MNRRDTLRILGVGAVSTTVLVQACKDKPESGSEETKFTYDRAKEELERDTALVNSEKFFTPEEMTTITILADIIIPKDAVSGSASDAKVPDFIDFIVKDMPSHQIPMRGGLRWVDMHCLKKYGKAFKDCDKTQQMELVDQIAYPNKAKPEMAQGVAFFTRMRNLTASGFYTSEIGVKDIGYVGNAPNQWNGVPPEVLKQYKLAYTEKELAECISFDKQA
jgi:gluconate 2-dehydrogenase gamma chain